MMVRLHEKCPARLLAYVSGMVNRQLLLQNEYLIAENRILRAHLSVSAQISSSRCQSVLFRASRETSRPNTIPARPRLTSVTSR